MQLRLVGSNYLFDDAVQISASSADSEFQVSNLARHERGRVWRSSGNFVITTASNDRIDFTIGAGNLVATIAAGTYTPTTLAAAIVTALSAAAAGTFTCSYSSSTGKWTLTKSAGTFTIAWLTGANLARSIGPTIGHSTAADLSGALTYTGASIAIHTEESVVLDLQTTEGINSFAAFFDPMNLLKLSSNAVVTLQANATNAWSAPSVSQVVSLDTAHDCLSHFFASTQSYRYWRLKIVDTANVYLYVELGVLVLGLATQLTYLPKVSFSYSLEDPSSYQETKYGHRYGDVLPFRKKLKLEYSALPYVDVQTLEAVYRLVGKGIPVLLAWDPTESYFDKDHFLIYGFFSDDFDVKSVAVSHFAPGLSIKEAL